MIAVVHRHLHPQPRPAQQGHALDAQRVNRAVRRWGIPIDDTVRAQDVGATTAPVDELAKSVEELRIRFEPTGRDAVDLVIEWDRTRVRVPIRRAPA